MLRASSGVSPEPGPVVGLAAGAGVGVGGASFSGLLHASAAANRDISNRTKSRFPRLLLPSGCMYNSSRIGNHCPPLKNGCPGVRSPAVPTAGISTLKTGPRPRLFFEEGRGLESRKRGRRLTPLAFAARSGSFENTACGRFLLLLFMPVVPVLRQTIEISAPATCRRG